MTSSEKILTATRTLRDQVNALTFANPVTYVYNPLDYAWHAHQEYVSRFANQPKKIIFLGMNPGPWGMAQTGVPFGEVDAVKNWMGIETPVASPPNPHPKRPILGFKCEKSEVSGRRLWGLFKQRFTRADAFFQEHFVVNFCPLVFMEESARNRTPDKLPVVEAKPLFEACADHLKVYVECLQPEWVVGIGGFAQKMIRTALSDYPIKQGKILHPSPASPAANRGWAETATLQLKAQNIWT